MALTSWLGTRLAVVVLCLFAVAEVAAIDLAIDDGDIARALKIAAQPKEARARFHAPYILPLVDATVERVEVITEFRRYVMVTEEQLRLGNWMFSQGVREAREAVRPWRGRLSIVVRLRFHPQNTFLDIPPFEARIGRSAIAPVDVVRTPIRAPLSGARGDVSAPLVGAVIETGFVAAAVGQATRIVSLWLNGEMLAQAAVPFSTLE